MNGFHKNLKKTFLSRMTRITTDHKHFVVKALDFSVLLRVIRGEILILRKR